MKIIVYGLVFFIIWAFMTLFVTGSILNFQGIQKTIIDLIVSGILFVLAVAIGRMTKKG
jgi:hypothetical protein